MQFLASAMMRTLSAVKQRKVTNMKKYYPMITADQELTPDQEDYAATTKEHGPPTGDDAHDAELYRLALARKYLRLLEVRPVAKAEHGAGGPPWGIDDMDLVFYHRTNSDVAEKILSEGFQDGHGTYMTEREWTGVWVSDRPLDGNEEASGDCLLKITLTCDEAAIADYEWVEEGTIRNYREWLIPADLLNQLGSIALELE
jgi:hypothetical protein